MYEIFYFIGKVRVIVFLPLVTSLTVSLSGVQILA